MLGAGVCQVMCKLGETWDWNYQTTHELFSKIDRQVIDKQTDKNGTMYFINYQYS